MKIAIQCAARKDPNAGSLTNDNVYPVLFVADPEKAQPSDDHLYVRPDDVNDAGNTWRELLIKYNNREENNPLNLYPAYKLYTNSMYAVLVNHSGNDNVFILSAGWGLIRSDFLTPKYDITFSPSAEKYKRRSKRDKYNDLFMLPNDSEGDLVFFGGKDYLPLFCELTGNYPGQRFVFYNAAVQPNAPGCKLIKYETSARTNWHYSCAKDFVAGKIGI